MENKAIIIPVELSDGTVINVEATPIGEQQVAFETLPFQKAITAIKSFSKEITETVKEVKHDKASVKFGLEIGIEANGLTALLAKGSGKANLEITLEWGK